jgi:hypothetical protein
LPLPSTTVQLKFDSRHVTLHAIGEYKKACSETALRASEELRAALVVVTSGPVGQSPGPEYVGPRQALLEAAGTGAGVADTDVDVMAA